MKINESLYIQNTSFSYTEIFYTMKTFQTIIHANVELVCDVSEMVSVSIIRA
jgi:hypothetical protein